MADIRINALATTAASTASDDFIAVDGSANGTRKLNAYSPTFGGNLTVSGTGTSSVGGAFNIGANCYVPNANYYRGKNAAGNSDYRLIGVTSGNVVSIDPDAAGATLGGNLTVSGGTITGGTSGMSLASGGTNQNITLTPDGTGEVRIGQTPNTAETLLSVVATGTAGATKILARLENNFATPTINNGAQLRFRVRNNNIGEGELAAITAFTESVTAGARTTGLAFSTGMQTEGLVERLRLTATGNLLIGTTTDSGNGKLQLATHTTSAGGIGFGTDISLYRATVAFYGFPAVNAALFRSSGSNLIFSSTNYNHYIGQKGDSGDFFISATDSITLQTRGNASNGTTALTLDSSQNATFAGKITANGAGSTFKGTATNDNAAAGYMGEFVSSAVVSGSAVSLTNATAANITSISLTAGDWDVTGLVQYNFTGATCSFVYHGFSSASASFGAPNSYVQDYRNYTTASVSTHNPSLTFRISLAATTTIYFVTQADFSAGTVAAYGRIQARRVR